MLFFSSFRQIFLVHPHYTTFFFQKGGPIRTLKTLLIIADPCVYNNLEFKGGDLSVIPSLGFEACKNACQKFKGCSFFTVNSVACILKDSNVEIHRKSGVLSGATDQTCGKWYKTSIKLWLSLLHVCNYLRTTRKYFPYSKVQMENQPLLSYINFFRACSGTVSPLFFVWYSKLIGK